MVEATPNPPSPYELLNLAIHYGGDLGEAELVLERLDFDQTLVLMKAVYGSELNRADDLDGALLRRHVMQVDDAFERICGADPTNGFSLFSALATSEQPKERLYAARLVHYLARSEALHAHGVEFWGRLLRDNEPAVRDEAFRRIDEDFLDTGTPTEVESYMATYNGLNWGESISLIEGYIRTLRWASRQSGPAAVPPEATSPPPAQTT